MDFRVSGGKGLTVLKFMATLLSVMGVMMTSCHTGVCTDNQNSIPVAGFYASDTEKAISVNDLDIAGVGAPNDSLLYTAGTALSTIYLPFRPDASETTYRFHFTYDDSVDEETGEKVEVNDFDDFITFRYTSTPYFDGEDCGAMYHYYITDVDYTTHYIERVVVTNPFITNTDSQRISIFFRTASGNDDNTEGDGNDAGDEGGDDENSGSESGDNNFEDGTGGGFPPIVTSVRKGPGR